MKPLEYQVQSKHIKQMLNDAGLIQWPVDVNEKGDPFPYVNNGADDLDRFEFRGAKYKLKYHSGCFYPFLYRIF